MVVFTDFVAKIFSFAALFMCLGCLPAEALHEPHHKKSITSRAEVDIVVFSYHRPLQLYAFLESLFLHSKGTNRVVAIIRADNERVKKAYGLVQKAFPSVTFRFQETPPDDFKALTLECAFWPKSRAAYLAFAVDDIVVTRPFDFRECTRAMERFGGYAFFLRLGVNIDYCYALSLPTPVPRHQNIDRKIISWKFSDGYGDWAYPQNVDLTVYRKSDLEPLVRNSTFTSPNTFEGDLARFPPVQQSGLCFAYSRIVNLPLNIVGTFSNRYYKESHLTPEELLSLFESGMKFDVRKMTKFKNNSAHFDYVPECVRR